MMPLNRRTIMLMLTVATVVLLALSTLSVAAQTDTPADVTWLAQYWNDVDPTGEPVVVRGEADIDHDWGQGSPDPAINPDHFSARWTTSVDLEEGNYRFTTVSDDGVRVHLDGVTIIDNWTLHPATTDTVALSVSAGSHEITVEYFENEGLANIQFDWEQLADPEEEQVSISPTSGTACGATYTVQPGDWLNQIAQQCGTTVEAILALNPQITNPNAINPGQVLQLPGADATTHFNLNLRPVPTTDSQPMDVVPAGTTLPVLGQDESGDWLLVNYDSQQGWIAGWLTNVEGSLTDVPVVPATDSPTPDEEAILILEPGPGSRVTSPVRVSGIADPTQHQELIVRLLLADGTEIAEAIATIEANLGERGPYEVDVPFTVTGEQQAFIQVLSRSARDGGITHLNSVGVTIAETGPVEIVTVDPRPARITIHEPAPGDIVSGGVAAVSGFGQASFEQTLVIEVQDEQGNVVGSEPVIVEGPGLGEPGAFSVNVAYSVTSAGPGRIVVRDPSPAFGGDTYVTTVEITLEP